MEKNHAREQALAQLESIHGLVNVLTESEQASQAEEKAREAIELDALEVKVRSDWYDPSNPHELEIRADQYRILLTTGGPAVRIKGELDHDLNPDTAQLEYQDWGTPWTRLDGLTKEDIDALVTYAGCFYFGE